MTVKLTIEEFESRLRESLREGEPWVMSTPLGMFSMNAGTEPFFGQVVNAQFSFTNNSFLSPTGAVIEGSFTKAENGTTIDYQVRTLFFPYFMVRAVPVVGGIIFNAILILNAQPFASNIVLTIFFGVAFLYWRWREKRGLKKLEKMFIKEFEMEDEVEWTIHTDSLIYKRFTKSE